MKKNIFVLLLMALMFFDCNDNSKTEVGPEKPQPKWNKITLETDFQSIYIFSDNDTMVSNTWRYKDSLVEPGHIAHVPVNRRQERVYLEPGIKDTIHALVMDMITRPHFTDISVTDYAGNITVCLQSANTELCCSYSSVGEWPTVSTNTRKLYDILSRKTKISPQ